MPKGRRFAHEGHLCKVGQNWREDEALAVPIMWHEDEKLHYTISIKRADKPIKANIGQKTCCGKIIRWDERGFAFCDVCGTVWNDGKPNAKEEAEAIRKRKHRTSYKQLCRC